MNYYFLITFVADGGCASEAALRQEAVQAGVPVDRLGDHPGLADDLVRDVLLLHAPHHQGRSGRPGQQTHVLDQERGVRALPQQCLHLLAPIDMSPHDPCPHMTPTPVPLSPLPL